MHNFVVHSNVEKVDILVWTKSPDGYYSAFISMRAIFCSREVWDEPTKAYYWRFEAAISAYVLSKCTSTKHVELNKTYVGVVMTMAPRGFRLCASSCQTIINKAKEFSMTWRTAPSWVCTITLRLQPLPMIYCAVTKIRHHNAHHIHHPGWWRLFSMTIQIVARHSQKQC